MKQLIAKHIKPLVFVCTVATASYLAACAPLEKDTKINSLTIEYIEQQAPAIAKIILNMNNVDTLRINIYNKEQNLVFARNKHYGKTYIYDTIEVSIQTFGTHELRVQAEGTSDTLHQTHILQIEPPNELALTGRKWMMTAYTAHYADGRIEDHYRILAESVRDDYVIFSDDNTVTSYEGTKKAKNSDPDIIARGTWNFFASARNASLAYSQNYKEGELVFYWDNLRISNGILTCTRTVGDNRNRTYHSLEYKEIQ